MNDDRQLTKGRILSVSRSILVSTLLIEHLNSSIVIRQLSFASRHRLIRHTPKRLENEGDSHGEHAGQPHTTRKTGQKHRGILSPHGAVAF